MEVSGNPLNLKRFQITITSQVLKIIEILNESVDFFSFGVQRQIIIIYWQFAIPLIYLYIKLSVCQLISVQLPFLIISYFSVVLISDTI